MPPESSSNFTVKIINAVFTDARAPLKLKHCTAFCRLAMVVLRHCNAMAAAVVNLKKIMRYAKAHASCAQNTCQVVNRSWCSVAWRGMA